MMSIFRYLGSSALDWARSVYDIGRLIAGVAASLIFRWNEGRKATVRVLLKQIYFTGFEAIPIISWIALVLGLIIVTQLLSVFQRVGGEGLIGEVLVWVVIREVGPVFASVVVIARSGTAIASELCSMKINREIASLELMGIDPMHYLVMPRVVGTAVSVFVLTFYFEAICILGGYLLAGFGKNIAFGAYIDSILEAMGFLEITVSLLKSALFGLIIGAVCSWQGLLGESSITQIPQRTTAAVIGSLRLVFVTDAAVTFIFFM